jgi:hypothetical protein
MARPQGRPDSFAIHRDDRNPLAGERADNAQPVERAPDHDNRDLLVRIVCVRHGNVSIDCVFDTPNPVGTLSCSSKPGMRIDRRGNAFVRIGKWPGLDESNQVTHLKEEGYAHVASVTVC